MAPGLSWSFVIECSSDDDEHLAYGLGHDVGREYAAFKKEPRTIFLGDIKTNVSNKNYKLLCIRQSTDFFYEEK